MKKKYLNAKGKGEFVYDYKYDTLLFKIRNREYKMSIEVQNFVIDIDKHNFVTGIQIFDVSKISGLDKIVFKQIVHGQFNATIEDNIITVRLKFVGRLRNRVIPIFSSKKDFVQQVTAPVGPKYALQDSEVTVPEIVC